MDRYITREVIRWTTESAETETHKLVGEAPLSVRVQHQPFSVGLRTPGQETDQAAGFCLTRGIVETPADFVSISYTGESAGDVVDVTLTPERWEKVSARFGQTEGEGNTRFGQDTAAVLETLCRTIPALPDGPAVDLAGGLQCLDNLNHHQPLRSVTFSTHATGVYTSSLELMTVAEDVGRHNGLDKAIGKLFRENRLNEAGVLVLSSRVSLELAQKAARARIPVIFSVSRPTALAVELASRLNMTIACLARNGGGYVYCGTHRLKMT